LSIIVVLLLRNEVIKVLGGICSIFVANPEDHVAEEEQENDPGLDESGVKYTV
jgi:hypothetical protein